MNGLQHQCAACNIPLCQLCAGFADGCLAGKRKAFFEMLNGFGGDAMVARKALFAQWTPKPSATDANPDCAAKGSRTQRSPLSGA